MSHRDDVWKLEHLSDAKLLESLGSVLRTQRRALAELVAHLGEVEDRRLHLAAAHGSMFTYCVTRLGMSEDEACRRIELARLVRKFPALLAELQTGRITLSVALVLKPVLSVSNHIELLAAARGKCVRQARELVAERFPRADAPSNIRKLPERRPLPPADRGEASVPHSKDSAPSPSLFTNTQTSPSSADALPAAASPRPPSLPMASLPVPAVAGPPKLSTLPLTMPAVEEPAVEEPAHPAAPRTGSAPPVSRSVIEPLSAERYRIQFTADALLKRQLEQARALLRHAHPSGDFGPIVSRALQLLIDDLMRRRFGARARRTSPRAAAAKSAHSSASDVDANRAASKSDTDPAASKADANRAASERIPKAPTSERPSSECSPAAGTSTAPSSCSSHSSHIPRAARRAVLERDGLGCSWLDANGMRCGTLAWLEFDHRQPRGKDGSSEPDNLRLLCRAHNLLAAEHAYGRDHIERCAQRRADGGAPRPPA